MNTTKDFSVRESYALTFGDLNALFEGKILALRIFDFYPKEQLQPLADQLIGYDHQINHYSMAEDVGVRRMGMTIFEAENKPKKLRDYHKHAKIAGEYLRRVCFPHPNPLDLLKSRLMESWPGGLRIEAALGELMNPGIVRVFDSGAFEGLPPHQDMLSRDLPDNQRARQMLSQLAANIYIRVPEIGGQIDIWNKEPDIEEFESMRDGRYDFIPREALPSNFVRIKPKVGELMLFRSSCVHAVLPSQSSARVAFSCSLGYFGLGESLSIWA